jgi:hypothetical protein
MTPKLIELFQMINIAEYDETNLTVQCRSIPPDMFMRMAAEINDKMFFNTGIVDYAKEQKIEELRNKILSTKHPIMRK